VVGGTDSLASLTTVGGTVSVGGDVTTTGNQSFGGEATIAGDTTFTGDDVSISGLRAVDSMSTSVRPAPRLMPMPTQLPTLQILMSRAT
jgi:UDP-3-O-[3-hydroxymyristoyl] glucosamine N-acyltransferase